MFISVSRANVGILDRSSSGKCIFKNKTPYNKKKLILVVFGFELI